MGGRGVGQGRGVGRGWVGWRPAAILKFIHCVMAIFIVHVSCQGDITFLSCSKLEPHVQ